MARIHGKSGQFYMAIASGGTAQPVAFMSDWTINFSLDKFEVTAMGDKNKVYVAGLPDASGDFTGWYDDATSQTYIAAVDGISRNFYLYPNTVLDPNQYFFGAIFPDFQVDGGVSKGVGVKATWVAASQIQRYGSGGLGT